MSQELFGRKLLIEVEEGWKGVNIKVSDNVFTSFLSVDGTSELSLAEQVGRALEKYIEGKQDEWQRFNLDGSYRK